MEGLLEIAGRDCEADLTRSASGDDEAVESDADILELEQNLEAAWKVAKKVLDGCDRPDSPDLPDDWDDCLRAPIEQILSHASASRQSLELKARAVCYYFSADHPTDQNFVDGFGVRQTIDKRLIQSILVGLMQRGVNPDAVLLDLGKKFDAELARTNAFYRTAKGLGVPMSADACDALTNVVRSVGDQILRLRAHTTEGVRLKARVIAWEQADIDLGVEEFSNLDGAKSILKDLISEDDVARVSAYWKA